MNWLGNDLGFSKTVDRFPTKGTCLAIYSACVNAEIPVEQVLATSFFLVLQMGSRTQAAVCFLC